MALALRPDTCGYIDLAAGIDGNARPLVGTDSSCLDKGHDADAEACGNGFADPFPARDLRI